MKRTAPAVASILSRRVTSVRPSTAVADALEQSRAAGSRHLMVAEAEHVVGILCSCDLDRAPPDHPVVLHMKAPVIVISATASLDEAAALMREKGIGSLPVVSGSLVVGIVTRADLIAAGVPRDRVGERCPSCGTQHHLAPGTGVRFCADCLECDRAAEVGGGD